MNIVINIDIFKQYDFGVIIYYLKFFANFEKSKRIDMKSILFLNKMFNEIEKLY